MGDKFFQRSPNLMNAGDTVIVVIDLQERLLPHIDGHETVFENAGRLLATAEILSVAVVGTEQYPQGLGPTVEPLRETLLRLNASAEAPIPAKTMFSCRECESLFGTLYQSGIQKILLCGIETHVCVAQTALDMVAAGFNVFVAVDAVGSRFRQDHDIALKRLEANGCHLTTTEAAMFELCEKAGSEQFKAVSKLLRGK
jgi:nicotinamidase-related amidase